MRGIVNNHEQVWVRTYETQVMSRKPTPHILPALIILAYVFVVTFTPNARALDTNATRFMTLSAINLVAFLYLVFNREGFLKPGLLKKFFTNNVGLVYAGFLITSLLSFTQAINLQESVLHAAKAFSVFSAVLLFWVILMRDIRYVNMIVFVMSLLLIFDSLSVYYHVNKFIQGDIPRLVDIKTIYSNKNILASAVYLKLPFALAMIMFGKGWLRALGWLALFAGMLATLFLATRAFYLGLFILSLVFLMYTGMHFLKNRDWHYLRLAGSYAVALILALAIHSAVQQNLFPQTGRHTQAVTQQLSTVVAVVVADPTAPREEASPWVRLDAWKRSMDIIQENPLLGVGAGNWKVNILKYENQENPGFRYTYKAHNDFLENMAETGFVGGLLFVSIFVLTGWNFIRQHLKNADKPGTLSQALFLSAFGLAYYAVDAFFNYPADRPEILLLWALFVSAGIAAHVTQKDQASTDAGENTTGNIARISRRPLLPKLFATGLILLLSANVYVFCLNYRFSKLQRIVVQDIKDGRLGYVAGKYLDPLNTWTTSPSITKETDIQKFPAIPNLSIWGESVGVLEARYLMEEGKHEDIIEALINDHTNPWDSRREYFLAKAYKHLSKNDKALYFAETAHRLKPNHFKTLHQFLLLLEDHGYTEDISARIDHYLDTQKNTPGAWLYAADFYNRTKGVDRAIELLEEARRHLPRDDQIADQHRLLYHKQDQVIEE